MNDALITESTLIDCLRLARTPGIGPVMFRKLLELYKSPRKALEALHEGACRDIATVCSVYDAEKEIEFCRRIGARIIDIFDKQYPKMLSNIFDPPPVITVLGNEDLLQSPRTVAIVGSRDASANSIRLAYELSLELSQMNFITVSGLARGVDSAVHSVAYQGKPTIAVIANGINVIYPRENAKLYKSIVREGGLLISELPFSAIPKASLFPQRNRIISGLSLCVVVVEASKKSGSLITANFALSQGREVFAVPGSPLDSRCAGSNDLIKQGAYLIESATDIISVLGFSGMTGMEHALRDTQKRTSKNTTTTPVQDLILKNLSISPTNIDDLVICCNLDVSVLLAALLELELAGRVERLPGNRFALITTSS